MAGVTAPERGQLIWIDCDPRLGREQGGRRPALVISNNEYNLKTGLLVCLTVTSKRKGYDTELPLPDGLKTQGVILTSHVYTMDWRVRNVQVIELVPSHVLEDAVDRLAALVSD